MRQYDDLKRKVLKLLKQHSGLDQLDLADKLGCALELTCKVCAELLSEGKIQVYVLKGRRPVTNELKEPR